MTHTATVHKYPKSVHLNWNPIMRFIFLGPFTGAFVGLIQVAVAVVIWVLHGLPDFYFRGAQGVVVTSFMFTVCGGLTGCIYGGVLLLFERFTRRRIRPLITLWLTLGLAALSAALIVTVEFQQEKVTWLGPQLSALVFGLLASLVSSANYETNGDVDLSPL
jgi:magnesium-transporting ATPase (P-type)